MIAVTIVGVGATLVHVIDIVQEGDLAAGNLIQNVANLLKPALLIPMLGSKELNGTRFVLLKPLTRTFASPLRRRSQLRNLERPRKGDLPASVGPGYRTRGNMLSPRRSTGSSWTSWKCEERWEHRTIIGHAVLLVVWLPGS